MASTDPFTYQRPSTIATRSLISDAKPVELPSGTLQRKPTNHYEQAAAAATKADQIPATTAGSVAASVNNGPGAKRQQSWKM